MAITLNDFKEGGKLRQFVTKVGLLDKIDSSDADQNDLLAKLRDSISHTVVAEDAEKNNWEYDEELDNTEVFEDDEINPNIEAPEEESKEEEKEDDKEEDDDDLPVVDDETPVPEGYTEEIPEEGKSEASVALRGDEVANSINDGSTFLNIDVADANISSNVTYNASNDLSISNIEVSGSKE